MYDDKSDEEESISNDCTLYSENICFVIYSLWNEREKNINTDYAVTGWMLRVIPHIRKDVLKKVHKINIMFRWIILSRLCLLDQLKKSYMKILIRSGENTKTSIKIMIPLTVINLSGILKILVMVKVIYDIQNTP